MRVLIADDHPSLNGSAAPARLLFVHQPAALERNGVHAIGAPA